MKVNRENVAGKRSFFLAIASACIPCCLLVLSLALLKIAPFGDNTLLLRDSVGQYIDYISYLKTVFTGENNLLYTFSKNLGGDVVSLASYYLLSPFNLLFAFSTSANLPLFFTAVVILKLSLCGFTLYYVLEKQFGAKSSHLIFSTAYALMSYNVLYEWNIMWLDGVLILPLMGHGVYRIWKDGSCKLYIFSLVYALFTNFYIGYMLCIASAIFSLAYFVLYEGGLKERFQILGKYIFASCISGFGTAFVWLPTFLNLQKGRAQFDKSVFSLTRNFGLSEFAAKLVVGAGGPEQLALGLPHIFCGTFTLFLVLVFFLNKKISRKKRIVALGTVMILGVSFYIRALDIIWHGFSPNNSFNYRYSFIFSYVLILIAQYAFSKLKDANFRTMTASAALILGLLVFVSLKNIEYVSSIGIGISLTVLISVFILTCLKTKATLLTTILIFTISIFEIGANCLLLLDGIVGEVTTLQLSEYSSYVQTVEPAIDYVKTTDPGFYRMEKTFQRSHNDAMFFSYNGLSHYSSSEQTFVLQFMQKMGFRNEADAWAYYNTGSTAEVDSLLGIKYVLSKNDLPAAKGYKLRTTINGIGIYENPNALPLAMFSSQSITDITMSEKDYFALHNAIWQGITDLDGDILQPEDNYTCSLTNLKQTIDEAGNNIYTKIDNTLPASIRYDIMSSQDKPLYFYFSSPDLQNACIFINGENNGPYFDTYRWDISSTGTHAVGEKVTIEIVLNSDEIAITEPYFYYEDLDMLTEQIAQIKSNDVQMTRLSSSHFTGEVNSEENGLLIFTIPYDVGWQISVDGEKTQLIKVLDTFLACEISGGHHTYTLHYIPRGTYAGGALTVLALMMAGLWFARTRVKKQKNK